MGGVRAKPLFRERHGRRFGIRKRIGRNANIVQPGSEGIHILKTFENAWASEGTRLQCALIPGKRGYEAVGKLSGTKIYSNSKNAT